MIPGCSVWLGAILMGGFFLVSKTVTAQSSGVLLEVYANTGGGVSIPDLTNHARFPNNPSSESITPDFEAPSNIGDEYGERMRALLVPPVSGSYVFYIASDDASELYLSTNDSPTAKQRIARVATWTGVRIWQETRDNNAPVQRSAPIPLTAGNRYYIEALMKEGIGGDNLAVTWQKPGDAVPVNGSTGPIPGSNLIPFGLGPPVITSHPANVTAVEGSAATFVVTLGRALGAAYQWFRNGVAIAGATSAGYSLSPVTLADSGSTFHCRATNAYGSTNSNAATLFVNTDTTRPTLSSVANLGDNQVVTVVFSEPVESSSATAASNYAITPGVQVLGTSLAEDLRSVILSTTPLSSGTTYTVSVSNVRDRASTPNTILPNSQQTFSLTFTPLDVGLLHGTPEPIGPSSRRTGLVISEIMYHPTNRNDGRNLEFVELYNSNPWPEDLTGHRLTGEIDYAFPAGTTLGALSYLVVAAAPADLQAVYGIGGVRGPYTNALSNGGGAVRLRDELGAVLLEAVYDDEPPYPVAADGAGHSLVLWRASFGERNPKAWAASDIVGGSPGTAETIRANPYRTILINEFLAHTDEPQLDFVELHNYSSSSVNISGCILTDDPTTNKFLIPAGTTVSARGFVSFAQTQLGFALSSEGETLYLKNTNATKVLDAVRFGGQENSVATGRYPDGAPGFYRLSSASPGGNNARPLVSPIVINELMYNPVSGDSDDEYVELYNRGPAPVNLGLWRLRGGVSFTFPHPTTVGPNNYLVVGRNPSRLMANHPGLTSANTLGEFSGGLGNNGDRLTLEKPDETVITNAFGVLVTNRFHVVVDEVDYGTGGRWGRFADGHGASLELIDARSDKRRAPNWTDSDDSQESGWTTVEHTGVLDHGAMASADQLHVILLGEGECLVDNVEVLPAAGGNVVANSTFESGTAGWVFQGTHEDTRWGTNAGFNSARSLHVVAAGRGDTGANRIRTTLTAALASGTTATLRARVKWLKGHPETLLRLHGNWLEATGNILTTTRLGTPGFPNSAARSNSGPAITDVAHSPILPSANQAVTVRASVQDPDGLASLFLNYRVDPATNFARVSMAYNGAGFYSAAIPGQVSGARAAFFIEAADNFSPRATTRFPADAPGRECLVSFGETTPAGAFGAYRLWLTQATVNRWASREKNSNRPLDATFAYGNSRVIYNARTLYSGSPWHTPGYSSPLSGSPDYVLVTPKDDLMLGATDFVLEVPADGTAQRHQVAFWIARKLGAPYLYRRFIHMFVNGTRRAGVYEDVQQPNSDVAEQFFPEDSNGTLHKIEDWFEFDDSGDVRLGNVDATLQNFTTSGGAKKLARYRWCWRPRAVQESANDFTNLFALVNAVNATAPEPFATGTESLVDIDSWMRMLAMQRICGNWDSYGYSRGKNMYAYKPEQGRWVLMSWDIEFVLGSGSDGPTAGLFGGNEPLVNKMHAHPSFLRAYWRAYEDAVNGPLLPSVMDPVLDAKYAALNANGISAGNPSDIKSFVASRRSYILSQLAGVPSGFNVAGAASFATNRNLITLSGSAPIRVKTFRINGTLYRPTWTSVSNWSLRLALAPGLNSLALQGLDHRGNAVAGTSASLSITYTGTIEQPEDKLVINEIMYNPSQADAGFVELHNTSTANAFDLSHWRISGVDCTIAEGTIIEPGAFLVFAKNRAVFADIYGPARPVAGEFPGNLDNGGETLRLLRPGAAPGTDSVIDAVTYDDDPPWPETADGAGPSLQLIDPAQENSRAANWGAVTPAEPGTNNNQVLMALTHSWRYDQTSNLDGVNWRAPGYNDAAWPAGPGLLYVENAVLPGPKSTPLAIGRLTYYFRTRFTFTGNPSAVSLKLSAILDDGAVFYLNGMELFRLGMPSGAIGYATAADRTVGDAAVEGPFVIPATGLLPGENVLAVEVHQVNSGSSDIVFGMTLETVAGSLPLSTPGAINSVRASLPSFPTLWLNEVLPNNVAGLTDRFGERDPWLEIYNNGASPVNLGGFYLANNYSNVAQWAFPANTFVQPRQFLVVWLDGEPAESIPAEIHAGFRIAPDAGSIVLAKPSGEGPMIIDYLNYSLPVAGRSFGAYPDGQGSGRRQFHVLTPGASNSPALLPVTVLLNEWMADNTGTLADPADGNHEDWLEIYNAEPFAVDLSDYFLTDNLSNTTKWAFPAGTVVAPRGFLLVWADEETDQNAPGVEPHTNFRLSAEGEALGLFAPDGALVDAVTFGLQTNDVSQGRLPDGQPAVAFLSAPTPRGPNLELVGSNQPPILRPIGHRTVDEGTLLTFTAVADDPNLSQVLRYSLDAGAPANATIDPVTGVFAWLPAEAHGPGAYTATVRVADNGEPPLEDSETFTITVREVNNAPVLAPLTSRAIDEGSPLVVSNSASDPDSVISQLSFSLDPVVPDGMTINPTNGTLTWTPSESDGPRSYFITVRVTDDGEPPLSATSGFTLVVHELNSAPVLNPISNQTNLAGDTVTFTAGAVDGDLPPQALTFSLAPGAPAGTAIDPVSGLFSWMPTVGQTPSTNLITVQVADDGLPPLSAARELTVFVFERLFITGIQASLPGSVTITWKSIPGKQYRVQYKGSLQDQSWTDLGNPIVADGVTTTAGDDPGPVQQRFYRVREE